MEVEPANFDQVRLAHETNDWVIIGADSSSTVQKIQEIDPNLRVRFSPRAGVFAVYERDRPVPPVLTCRGHRNRSGTWEGLDDRVVRRLEYIDRNGRGGYDFTRALERARLDREKREAERFRKRTEDGGERMAHAIRKELGLGSYQGRVFIPRDIR